MSNLPPLFKHQEEDVRFHLERDYVYNCNEAGTGKTRTCLETYRRRAEKGLAKRALVTAPKSLLRTAWSFDIEKFLPGASYGIAWAEDRERPFKENKDIVLINHDGMKWLANNAHLLEDFTDEYGDESTVFKHHMSQRSKAANKVSQHFDFKVMQTGTPTSLSITELWHQVFLLDGGAALGKSFYKFRHECCVQIAKGGFTSWVDKEGINDLVGSLIGDFTLTRKLEDCVSIPANHTYTIPFTLNASHMATYHKMAKSAMIKLNSGQVNAIHAASLKEKLMQIASGAVYDGLGNYHVIDQDRYELILDLVEARPQSVVAFTWRHQRDELCRAARKRKLSFGLIDSSANSALQEHTVRQFQNGELRCVFIQPKSGAHGLTLTAGTTTIWASPTTEPERFEQINRRIYRAGQNKKTETILIEAEGTLEPAKYAQLNGRIDRATDLREFLHLTTQLRAA